MYSRLERTCGQRALLVCTVRFKRERDRERERKRERERESCKLASGTGMITRTAVPSLQ